MSKKLTKEEFMRRVYENNVHVRNGDIEIIGEYNAFLAYIMLDKKGDVRYA